MLSYLTDIRFIVGLLIGWLGIPFVLNFLRARASSAAA